MSRSDKLPPKDWTEPELDFYFSPKKGDKRDREIAWGSSIAELEAIPRSDKSPSKDWREPELDYYSSLKKDGERDGEIAWGSLTADLNPLHDDPDEYILGCKNGTVFAMLAADMLNGLDVPLDREYILQRDLTVDIALAILSFARDSDIAQNCGRGSLVIRFMHRHASSISRAVIARAVRLPVDEARNNESIGDIRRTSFAGSPSTEDGCKEETTSVGSGGFDRRPASQLSYETLARQPAVTLVEKAISMFRQGFVYQHLKTQIHNIFKLTPKAGTLQILHSVLYLGLDERVPTSGNCTAIFKVEWNPEAFLSEQFEHQVRLGNVIVLTESFGYVQATTCRQYMIQTWPFTGEKTLLAIENILGDGSRQKSQYTIVQALIEVELTGQALFITIEGSKLAIIEVAEQFCWLGAACRAADISVGTQAFHPRLSSVTDHFDHTLPQQPHQTYGHKCAKCHESFGRLLDLRVHDFKKHRTRLRLGARIHEPMDRTVHRLEAHSSFFLDFERRPFEQLAGAHDCWHSMFRNPAVACGFRVLARTPAQKGLEIPMNIMASLVDADVISSFDGQVMLKGFSSILVPTSRTKTSVVWHFVHGTEERMPFSAAFSLVNERVALDFSCLDHSRHFVGWVSSAVLRTGTQGVHYSIRQPQAKHARAGCALSGVSVSGGKFISGGVSFVKGNKDRPLWLSYDGSYVQKVHFMTKVNVILFDDGEQDRRGWLVTGACAVLHMLRTQLCLAPYSDSEYLKIEDFNYAVANGNPGAAKNALLGKRNMMLKWDEEQDYTRETRISEAGEMNEEKVTTKIWTVKNLVEQLWHTLEQMYDYQDKIQEATSIHLRGTTRDKLEGWSFREIIEGDKQISPRVTILNSSGRGWVDFARRIKAVTLLGRGFGDLIVPAPSAAVCPMWKQVPTRLDYLTASIHMLIGICEKHGDPEAKPLELVDGIYWHQAHALFDPCESSQGKKQKSCCDRVQVLLPKLAIRSHKKQASPFFSQNGAVIFGRSERFKIHWPLLGPPVEGDGPPDDDDSGLGSSLTSSETSSSRD